MTQSPNLPSDLPVIVHILNGLQFGGNETLCLQLLRYAPPTVHNILFNLNPSHQEMLSLFQEIPGLTIIHNTVPLHPRHRFIRSLQHQFQRWRPQAVLVYSFGIHPFAGLTARLTGTPVIVVHGGNPPPQPGKPGRWKWRVLIGISWLLNIPIYGCSHATQQALTNLLPLPVHSFAIPIGCDTQKIAQRAEVSRLNHQKGDRLIIGMVARLNSIKDQATLIHACSHLHQTWPQVELWIVGDGEERDRLEQLCNDLGLIETVRFWGIRSDVPELLGQMDIYAFSTTENEGFGIAIIEAMAASLPIVASNVAACREVLDNGKAGILVKPQDSLAMAKELERLIGSPQEREKWGQRAYTRAATHYSIQTCAQQWYKLLLAPGGN